MWKEFFGGVFGKKEKVIQKTGGQSDNLTQKPEAITEQKEKMVQNTGNQSDELSERHGSIEKQKTEETQNTGAQSTELTIRPETITEQNENEHRKTILENWHNIIIKNPDDPNFSKVRQEYLEIVVEKPYQQFLIEFGPVKTNSINEYRTSQKNFENFIKSHPLPPRISHHNYDFGERFNRDALLNDDAFLNKDEQSYIREYLIKISPYSDHRRRALNESYQGFLDNYPNPNNILNALSYLYKKARKHMALASLYQVWSVTGETAKTLDQEKFPKLLKSFLEKGKWNHQLDVSFHVNANPTYIDVFNFLLEHLHGGKEAYQKAYEEFPDELFHELKTEYGYDFRPLE